MGNLKLIQVVIIIKNVTNEGACMINSFKITWKTHIKIILLSYFVTIILNNSVNTILDNFIFSEFIKYPTSILIVNMYIYFIILMIPISIVHEYIHGFFFVLFGGKVKYGYKIIYAYTQEISGMPIKKIKFIIILLAPLVSITILSIFLPRNIGGMIYLLNLLGSMGDVYIGFTLCKYNFNCKIIDRNYGYDIIN